MSQRNSVRLSVHVTPELSQAIEDTALLSRLPTQDWHRAVLARAVNEGAFRPVSKPRVYGTGSIYLRRNMWWIEYLVRGKRFRESAGTTHQAARHLLAQRLREAGKIP